MIELTTTVEMSEEVDRVVSTADGEEVVVETMKVSEEVDRVVSVADEEDAKVETMKVSSISEAVNPRVVVLEDDGKLVEAEVSIVEVC